MKVLLGHNYYRTSSPSGEDAVFHNERQLLEERGVEVISFERFNDHLDDSTVGKKTRAALNGVWSRETFQALTSLIRKEKPDLVHFHNTFPQISPSAYAACRKQGVPVVQTLHNFRFICPGALLMRNGQPCEECVGSYPWPALRHRCYRKSWLATAAQVMAIARNRWTDTYKNRVNRYIALTRFSANRLMDGGIPGHSLDVRPNFLAHPPPVGSGEGNFFVFVGRLSEEKGVRTLIEAWRHVSGIPLIIIGDGPLRGELESKANQQRSQIKFLGFRSKHEVLAEVGKARALVLPSECYEGFPMAVLEAYANGTPVLASRIGSLDEIVRDGETGEKFSAGDPLDLANKAKALNSSFESLQRMRKRARRIFEEKYTADAAYDCLINIYSKVLFGAGNALR